MENDPALEGLYTRYILLLFRTSDYMLAEYAPCKMKFLFQLSGVYYFHHVRNSVIASTIKFFDL